MTGAFLALVVLAACQKSNDSPTPTPAAKKPGDPDVSTAGSEPRHELRYHLAKGSTRKIQFSMDLDLEAGPLSGPMPTMVSTGEIVVEDVTPDGNARIKMTIHDLQIRDRPGSKISADVMRPMLGGLDGFAISAKLSPLGAMSDAKVDVKNLPPQLAQQVDSMRQNLEQLAVPLPSEPVGDGASWAVDKTLAQNGMTLTTHTKVTLVKSDGDKLSFKTETKLSGADQKLEQAGMVVDIRNIGGGGGGDGSIDLSSLVVGGTFTSGFHADMVAGDQPLKTDMKMKVTMTPQ